MHHPWLFEPHEVTAVESREFIKAGNISEYQATHSQLSTGFVGLLEVFRQRPNSVVRATPPATSFAGPSRITSS